MQWIEDYQVFLFDFDGLLVNTEEVHYHAYQLACSFYGWTMPWTFPEYCTMAHYSAEGLRDRMFEINPELVRMGWVPFYDKKTQIITQLVSSGKVSLMPGVVQFLSRLEEKRKKRAVVTHSKDVLVKPIREQHPILNTIPNWITREYYTNPKPDPECYKKAIELLANEEDRIIGFEDTPRGIKALCGTRAEPVIISQIPYPEIEEFKKKGIRHYQTFESFLS